MATPSGYKFPILTSTGVATSTVVDMADMFVRKELFLNAGLMSWGYNNQGQLGNVIPFVTAINYSSPIQIGTLTNWKQVSGGSSHTLAIKTDGTLWAWGDNSHGELGANSPTLAFSSPIQISSLTNWKQVSSGYFHTSAIKTDSTLWTWGSDGGTGSLGNGTTISYSSPIQIGTLSNWKQVSMSGSSTFGEAFVTATKTDGTLWTWGYNAAGQLGNGTTVYYSSPIQVGSLNTWKQVNGGFRNAIAIKTDGTLWTWGRNDYGQLGNGTIVYYSSPIQVGSLTTWKQVSGGLNHNTAIKTNGTLWMWGFNASGQLGNGTMVSYSSPIQIGSLTTWKNISLGRFHSLAISSPDLP